MNAVTAGPTPEPESRLDSHLLKAALPLTAVALLLGLSVELLFHGHPLGVSFPIWASLCVAALLALAAGLKVQHGLPSWLLPVGVLFLSFMAFLRSEPLTIFLDILLTLMIFALWVRSFRHGRLADYGWLDFGLALVWVPLEAWLRPWSVLSAAGKKGFGERGARSTLAAVLRGLLLSIPILVVFILLLRSADLVFAGILDRALSWLDLERLASWAGRVLLVVVSGVFFLGALVAALRDPAGRKLIGEGRTLLPAFLGSTEALVVLGLVDTLFAAFVVIQLAYLFGGQGNITAAGYTYSEYARRGFGELVAVGVLSLALIISLAMVTKRERREQTNWFNGLSAALMALATVILASAWMRLLLYEAAYGFSRLRTYTHVAIPWIGVLFVAFTGLLFARQWRRFPLVVALGMLGFTVTLNLVNVDVFIVRHNVARMVQSDELDLDYLTSLSDDALPELVAWSRTAPPEVAAELMPRLACRRAELQERQQQLRLPSYHLSRARAMRALDGMAGQLEAYPITRDEYGVLQVGVGGVPEPCWRNYMID